MLQVIEWQYVRDQLELCNTAVLLKAFNVDQPHQTK